MSTICRTYPVLFLGRSFVAPNNGGSPQLYDSPPFAAGSIDMEIEDVRGSDTAATLYEFVPYSHVQRDALALGEVPLWNRHNAAGRPLWGQGMSLLLDPLHWLTLCCAGSVVGMGPQVHRPSICLRTWRGLRRAGRDGRLASGQHSSRPARRSSASTPTA